MSKVYLDTETCGLHGPIILIQYALEDEDIQLHSVWRSPISQTIELIEYLVQNEVIGFNLSFDWFHICQLYTTLIQFKNRDVYPEDHIEEYAEYEALGPKGPCIKPTGAFDIMLHARKGPYQSTMNRDDIVIKRVPTALANELIKELDKRIKLKNVYFARKQNPKERWSVDDVHDEEGELDVDFKNVVLRFAPSSALKALTEDALGIDTGAIARFADVEPPDKSYPEELGYAPYAKAIGSPGNWKGAWPDDGKITVHIKHWAFNRLAREYASDDVKYTRILYKHFGSPQVNDDDSILACMVGAVRWRGFSIDVDRINALKRKASAVIEGMSFNFESPRVCRKYLEQVLSETEKLVLRVDGKVTTKGVILEAIAKWKNTEVHEACNGQGCKDCDDGLVKSDKPHPAAERASEILMARHAKKEVELYDKLLQAGRFHADLNVIGTRSSRMSGASGLNAQGIRRTEETRSCFPLADGDLTLCGGDFAGFEVNLADAAYGDPVLRQELISGKKIHGLFGMYLFPGKTYEQICATKGRPAEQDLYTRSKNGVYAMLYGGEAHTLVNRVGITAEAADEAYRQWTGKYKVWGKARQEIFNQFCSMRQPGGIGTKVEWVEPADYAESLFGFRRYFTLENEICKALFTLAEDPPKEWQKLKLKIVRRDREQTACGALRSALFAAAFAVQAANMRAAGNHRIQASGAQICKRLQKVLWDLQPAGINRWRVQPLNVHDEIMCPAIPELIPTIRERVNAFIEEYKPKVPLIEIEWSDKLASWADK